MEPVVEALKIVDSRKVNINGKDTFHNESFIYVKTNERLQDFVEYIQNKERILSVIASGDQIINSLLTSPKEVDCFDISVYPEYFLNLKLAALLSLTKEEYISLFFDSTLTTLDEYYDELYFEKIRLNLADKYREFWDALFNHSDWYEIYSSILFSSEVVTKEYALRQNKYLSDREYEKLKDIIPNTKFNYKVGNILDIYSEYNKPYDLIYLSNICMYVDKEEYKRMLDELPVSEEGYILTYVFDRVDKYESLFLDQNPTFINLGNTENSIMLHKAKKIGSK